MNPCYETPTISIFNGDCLEVLQTLPDQSVNCCVTSPPYWGLRDYGVAGQLGLERTPEEYVEKMVVVFEEVRRVLRDDGTLWLNIGDSYAGSGRGRNSDGTPAPGSDKQRSNHGSQRGSILPAGLHKGIVDGEGCGRAWVPAPTGYKQKDLIGVPWMLAFALRGAGWYLRSDIIWAKPNGMPESVEDRPTRSHEYIFLLSKNRRYHYDGAAIEELASMASMARWNQNLEGQHGSLRANGGAKTNGTMKAVGGPDKQRGHSRRHDGFNDRWDAMEKLEQCAGTRQKRDVWWVSPQPFPEAHFATFPEELILPCILAGCPAGGTVLDPFFGSGTTGLVAQTNGCKAIGIELNPEYIEIAKRRLAQDVFAYA